MAIERKYTRGWILNSGGELNRDVLDIRQPSLIERLPQLRMSNGFTLSRGLGARMRLEQIDIFEMYVRARSTVKSLW